MLRNEGFDGLAQKVSVRVSGEEANQVLSIVLRMVNSEKYGLTNILKFKPGQLQHIFEGNLNTSGKATGFHHKSSALNPNTKVLNYYNLDGTPSGGNIPVTNLQGAYKAGTQIDGVIKTSNRGISTMFPDNWTKLQVVDSIMEAYNDSNRV